MEKEKLLLFLSYSRSNQEYIEKIAKDIKKLEHNIWFDNQISGGQRWWNQILAQIRKADILVFILSQESLHSTACQCEYDYAAALGKPILPVLIDNKVSVNTLPDPLTQIPLVEYRVRNADSIIELATSLFTIDISKDLPDPLPDPPNVPGTYLGTIIEKLEVEKTLSINEQSALWIQLKEYYERTSSKSDAIISIKKLQSRSDLLASIDREISRFLLKFDNQKANPPALPANGKNLAKSEKYTGVHPYSQNQQEANNSMKVKQLLNELTHIETPPSRRLMIGKLLNQLGDTRQGIGLDKEGLPDIDWVAIPSGKFTYQENQKKVSKQFFLSRYPVTNAQFRAFVDSRGYEVSSAFEGFLSPKEADQWWLDLEKKSTPPDHKWTDDNRPCENISWYDAVAFCRWLSTKKGYEIRLPKEQEWEKGARGSNGREYPWGDHYKTGIANINERYEEASEDIKNVGDYYLEETTAVGVYPHGQSPYGLMDVSGNIWEWCLNNSHSPEMTTLDKSAKSRTLRGGAWSLNSQFARTTNRSSGSSIKRESFVGFRLLAISLINAKNDNGGAIKTSKDERTSKSDSGKKEELDSAYYKNQSVVKSTSKDNLEKSTTRKTKDKKNKQEKKYINNLSEKPEKNIAKRVLLLLLIVLGVIFGLFYLNNSYHEVPDYYSSDNSNSLNNTVSACDFCSLTVYSDPGDARIRIMNIKRKYKLGIILPRGYYRIRVDRPGYVTYNEELYIKNEKPIYITLDRKW